MAKVPGIEQLKGPDGLTIDRLMSEELDELQKEHDNSMTEEEWKKAWKSYASGPLQKWKAQRNSQPGVAAEYQARKSKPAG